ncbi:MAG: Gfo/Idh/MocA family oxidoreductase [Saprospiraceae bacterium]|nr:Gfo/Idh/MocA family oxidoreductase [Saprospiraceae bacterium]
MESLTGTLYQETKLFIHIKTIPIMSERNRRKFIQHSSMLTGGLLLNPTMRNLRTKKPAESLKIGLVGCGGRGTGAAVQALTANTGNKLVAIADVFEDQTKKCLKHLSGINEISDQVMVPDENTFVGFDAYQKVIRACDVVLLATPPAFRPEHFEYAVQENTHAFIEKPLACDGAGIQRIVQAGKEATRKNLKVVVGLQNRYDPAHNEMVERIKKGAIGDVLSSTCYYMKGGYELYPRASTSSELAFQIRNYHYFTWLWAGAPGGLQIHNADIVHWVKDSYPISAQGLGGRAVLRGKDSGDVFDHFYIEYTYADGTRMHSEVRNIDRTFRKNGVWFTGSKGTANVRDGIKTHSGRQTWKFDDSDAGNSLQIEHDRFFDAIINDTPMNNTEYGANSSLASIMGRMAAHTGQVITWDDALNSPALVEQDIRDWSQAPTVPNEEGIYRFPRPGQDLAMTN